jgi:hypothetical protein
MYTGLFILCLAGLLVLLIFRNQIISRTIQLVLWIFRQLCVYIKMNTSDFSYTECVVKVKWRCYAWADKALSHTDTACG